VTPGLALTLLGLGTVGAFVSGLLGVGGALVMIPLLLYVPPLLGAGALDVKAVAAITMVQVFVASLTGMLAHRRHKAVHRELALLGGIAMAAGAFSGALLSKFVGDRWLLLVFALMATAAALLLVAPVEWLAPPTVVPASDGSLRFSRPRTVAVAGGVGIAAGLVGAGGAFLLVPLLLAVVGVPIRVTIGSSLAITVLASAAGVAGKLLTGQVPAGPALLVCLGALPAAHLGAAVSRRLAAPHLRLALLAIVVLTAARVWWDLLVGRGLP
jgi:uncharacterized membrane protein YfcA